MSIFKHSKGKLFEQPTQGKPFKIVCTKAYEFEGREFKVGEISENSWGRNVPENWKIAPLREYIAEGFAEDELVEEKDFILFECDLCDGCGWYEGGKTLKTHCNKCDGKGVTARRKITKEFDKEEMKKVQDDIDSVNKGAIIDRAKLLGIQSIGNDELCDIVQNACQLINGFKQDAIAGNYWSGWDESVYQSLVDILRKTQPLYGNATKEEGEKPFIALTFDTMMAGGNTDNEKAFFKLGYEAASKEINRLKGLI